MLSHHRYRRVQQQRDLRNLMHANRPRSELRNVPRISEPS